MKKEDFLTYDDKSLYGLLSRMKSDCEYFLGCGNRCEKYLWGLTVKEHIEYMKYIYNILKVKPEWLSMKNIMDYEKKMN